MAVAHAPQLDEPASVVRSRRASTVAAHSRTAPGRRAVRTDRRHERDVASLKAASVPEALIGVPFN